MPNPRPYLFCPTIDHQKATVRALYMLGHSCLYSPLSAVLNQMDNRPDDFRAYPYVGLGHRGNEIDWQGTIGPNMTTVNSVSHMSRYLKRIKPLTPGARPS